MMDRVRRSGLSTGGVVTGVAAGTFAVVLLRQIPQPETFWPKAILTYVAAFTALFAFLHTLYRHAKTLVQLNGLGERVTELALAIKGLQEQAYKLDRMAELGTIAREEIRTQVGRAQKSADACNDEVDRLRTDVVAFLNDMRREASERNERVTERLARIDTRLDLRPPDRR